MLRRFHSTLFFSSLVFVAASDFPDTLTGVRQLVVLSHAGHHVTMHHSALQVVR